MASTDTRSGTSAAAPEPGTIDMALEVVTLAVADVERAKRFYEGLGWRMDADFGAGDARGVQFTPPHSPTSIHILGTALAASPPGSADRIILAVKDITAAREDLVRRGVDVSEVYEQRPPGFESVPGRSYFAYASFRDPDGNGWLLQEITTRLPGREWGD